MGTADRWSASRVETLLHLLSHEQRPVVIDVGHVPTACHTGAEHLRTRLVAEADHSYLVSRACYLSMRRALASPLRSNGVILLREPGRSLDAVDVASILALPESAWSPALDAGGDPREGAWVAELPLELSAWPQGTRALCRRERPHPGAQLSFSDAGGHRFQVVLTNQQGQRLARLEQVHRQRAATRGRDPLRQGERPA